MKDTGKPKIMSESEENDVVWLIENFDKLDKLDQKKFDLFLTQVTAPMHILTQETEIQYPREITTKLIAKYKKHK